MGTATTFRPEFCGCVPCATGATRKFVNLIYPNTPDKGLSAENIIEPVAKKSRLKNKVYTLESIQNIHAIIRELAGTQTPALSKAAAPSHSRATAATQPARLPARDNISAIPTPIGITHHNVAVTDAV